MCTRIIGRVGHGMDEGAFGRFGRFGYSGKKTGMALERTERHLPSEEGSEQGDHSGEGGEKRGKAGRGIGKGEDTKKAEPPARATRLGLGGVGLLSLERGYPRMLR